MLGLKIAKLEQCNTFKSQNPIFEVLLKVKPSKSQFSFKNRFLSGLVIKLVNILVLESI